MESEGIQMEIPLEWNIRKVYPLPGQIIKKPNELLEAILSNESLPARKVFYIVLAKNHVAHQDTMTYIIPFTDLYRNKKNASIRGPQLKEAVRKSFQDTSFAVDKEFVRLILKQDVNEPYISPFSMVDYIKGCFHVTLTSHFKKYLQYACDFDSGWTSGHLNLLLSFHHQATDKLYWIIRSKQWIRGTTEITIDELKFNLGYLHSTNKNFCSQTLPAIQKELKGSWAAFEFTKLMKGREIRSIKLNFDKNEVIINKLKNDLKYEYEIELLKRGVRVEYIHNIRCFIMNRDVLRKKDLTYTWDAHYVLLTIRLVDREHSNGKLKNKVSFLTKALFEGYYVQIAHDIPRETPPGAPYLPFGRWVKSGVSINATKAFTETYVREYAATQGKTLEEYCDWLKHEKDITLYRYINPRNGQVWLLDSVYVKRLRILENKSAIEGQILYQK